MQTPSQILIIRHAEKPASPSLHLSEIGLIRARSLYTLVARTIIERPPLHAIFAAANSRKSWRPLETVQPIATALGLPVNASFDDDEYKKLSDLLLRKGQYADQRILISWRHENLPSLAIALGATDCPRTWPMNVYDRLWLLKYSDTGKVRFQSVPQALLPGDSLT